MFCYYANLVSDDIIGCASTVVWHKIKNFSTNNEAILLKLGRDAAPWEIYQMLCNLRLLWLHARFQSSAPSKWNITICDSTRVNTWSYGRCGGLMVRVFVSGSSGPGSSPGRGHCVVFLGKTLNSHSASLHPGVQMGIGKFNAGG